jgi:hypothetical protein
MENMLNQVVASFLTVMEGHAGKSFAQIAKELSKFRTDFSLEINKLSDSMENLILQIEQNHNVVIRWFVFVSLVLVLGFVGHGKRFTGLEVRLDHIAIWKNKEPGHLPVSMLPIAETLIGRENIMEKLKNALENRGAKAALVGGAGMGKTSCAKQFAMDFVAKDPKNRFVFWLLSSEMKASYTKALKHLRESSGETANDAEEEEVTLEKLASNVWDRLQTLSNRFEWLLVFDNVPEVDCEKAGPEAFQDKYFPNADGTLGRILFTVRSDQYGGQNHGFGEITAIEVQKLDADAATEMFKTKVGPYFSEDAARELVTDYFDGLPWQSLQLLV